MLFLSIASVAASERLDHQQHKVDASMGIIGNLLHKNDNQLVVYPYESNYIMHSYVSSINKKAIRSYEWAEHARKDETKYQISLGFPIWRNLFGKGSLLGASYTQRSFWQSFNSAQSSPFRETNYEPQIFLGWDLNYSLFGIHFKDVEIGFNHQSNGRPEETSRSWNRVYGRVMAKVQHFLIDIKAWYRVPESKKSDDNPDIISYLGHYRVKLGYENRGHIFSLAGGYNWNSGYGSAELGWSMPVSHSLRFYTQLFSGYGESLIDYNKNVTRFGVGVMLNDLPFETDAQRRVQAKSDQEKGKPITGIMANLLGTNKRPLLFYAYEPNYILHTFTSRINKNALAGHQWAKDAQKDETKFQISLGFPIWQDIFGKDTLLAASYTQRSFWQSTNSGESSPFRETNYEPQVFVGMLVDWPLLGNWRIKSLETGFNHQSNGQPQETSRSWNRIYGRMLARNDNWLVDVKAWYRIPESSKSDDNPDLTKYMGYHRTKIGYHHNGHIVSVSGQYNWNSGYGGVEMGWSYPVSKSLRVYTQVQSGYGESLIDYNHKQTRFGIGLMLNDIF